MDIGVFSFATNKTADPAALLRMTSLGIIWTNDKQASAFISYCLSAQREK
jgi:hypothetical protein